MKCELSLSALKASSKVFFCGNCEEKQLKKLCFVDSDAGQNVIYANYMGDCGLKQNKKKKEVKVTRIRTGI